MKFITLQWSKMLLIIALIRHAKRNVKIQWIVDLYNSMVSSLINDIYRTESILANDWTKFNIGKLQD